ncbi:MAG: hypothetical protein ABSB19_20630 [Methylomonas sp.]|jgi:hypothetical protein
MQAQDYVTFFQNLLASYYQVTLDNAVYAACLAISVWLLTAILYSFTISSLNRKIKAYQSANQAAQNNLNAAEAKLVLAQQELSDVQHQLEEQAVRYSALQTRFDEINAQLTENIQSLASDPDLGQQGLTVRDGLPTEQLLQRYQGAVKQLCERVHTELDNVSRLTLANKESADKLADQTLQLQAARLKADNMQQQVVKLESSFQQQAGQLAAQQEESEQVLMATEAKYQADIAKLVLLENQVAEFQQKLKTQSEKPLISDPVKQFETPRQAQIVAPEIKPVSALQESAPAPVARTRSDMPAPERKPEIEAAAVAQSESVPKKTAVSATDSGFSNRFKSMLSNARAKIDKLDEKLGQRTPLPLDLEEPEPEENVIPVASASVKEPVYNNSTVENAPIRETAAKSSGGMGGKFKNLFGSAKTKPENLPADSAVPETSAKVEYTETPVDKPITGGFGGKLKSLLGSGKSATVAETPATAAVPETPAPEPPPRANTAGQIKNLFGKFTRKN